VVASRVEELPRPLVKVVRRLRKRAKCPLCAPSCYRDKIREPKDSDLGDLRKGRPVELRVLYSQHYCRKCGKYFSVEMTDLADPVAQHTRRPLELAVRLVVEDGLPYRQASRHL